MQLLKLVVLISGRGSNLKAIIDSIESKKLNSEILCVISDNPNAYGLKIASDHNIETILLDYKKFPSKDEYEKSLLTILKEKNPDLICLAGYMRIVGKDVINAFKNKIINIHPALLPSFPGLHAQKQAIDYGVKISGCTVHFVDEGCDTGPIILQKAVNVADDDDEASLSKKILEQEHIAYSEAISLIAQGRVKIFGRKTKIERQG